ncbi:putative membrane protein [Vibrio parahaemolyticus AQ3810]|nr:putative membrane protein [Vibrio parahaemolyticus AQ3810]
MTLLKVRTVRLVSQKLFFGVVSPFSAALFVLSGFIDLAL